MLDARMEDFRRLFAEFLASYPQTAEGQEHIRRYEESRIEAERNWKDILAKRERGEDVTDDVLCKLLPYDVIAKSKGDFWIHNAPVFGGHMRNLFERGGWARPEDWPQVAQAVLRFVERCVGDPADLAAACKEFDSSPYRRGFQAGTLSPILSALRPDEMVVINSKSRKVVNYFGGTNHGQRLVDYPILNQLARDLVHEVAGEMHREAAPAMRDDDLFDMFCHWLVAVKKYNLDRQLAEPFASIFRDWDEAEWAMGLLRETLDRLGVKGPDDKRFALTLRYYPRGRRVLRLSFGIWLILDFGATNNENYVSNVALLADKATHLKQYDAGHFTARTGMPTTHLYALPREWLRDPEHGELALYYETLEHIAKTFAGWIGTPFRRAHQERVARVLFDDAELQRVLSEGPFDQDGGKVEPDKRAVPGDRYFTEATFELLSQLQQNPTAAFHQSHKDEFARNVEGPFQQLFTDLAPLLRPQAAELLETKRGVFSRIPKNDYGRGGAWPYYWGAFYPKGGKRTADAQLYMVIDAQELRCGFDIGEYGQEPRSRFQRNLALLRTSGSGILGDLLDSDTTFLYGADETSVDSYEAWLQQAPPEPRVSVSLAAEDALATSREELVSHVSKTFDVLFPLVLMAILDDPLPAIEEYLVGKPVPDKEPPYPIEQCAEETGISIDTLRGWLRGLERKKQIVLSGPPGTGKTFLAQALARHLVGGTDGFSEIVQLHPAYAYEDFVQGIRPESRADGTLSYPVVPGRFLQFCKEAAQRQGPCVLIIDEINRANLARVFGELMFLLEYRHQAVPLAVDGRKFSIPANVRLIGTMNTADRSIALVDHALRRRFAFVEVAPDYEVLRKWHERHTGFPTAGLIDVLKQVNARIGDHNYAVGISFFLHQDLPAQLKDIWEMEIIPYLDEYFFDRASAVQEFHWDKIRYRVMPQP